MRESLVEAAAALPPTLGHGAEGLRCKCVHSWERGLAPPKELAREESEIDSSFKITHEHSTLGRDPAPLLGYRGHGVLPQ